MLEPDLRVPFIVCQTAGGPYDDQAFMIGFQIGIIYGALRERKLPRYETAVPDDALILQQVDLVAMRYGYTIRGWTWPEQPGWARIVATRVDNP